LPLFLRLRKCFLYNPQVPGFFRDFGYDLPSGKLLPLNGQSLFLKSVDPIAPMFSKNPGKPLTLFPGASHIGFSGNLEDFFPPSRGTNRAGFQAGDLTIAYYSLPAFVFFLCFWGLWFSPWFLGLLVIFWGLGRLPSWHQRLG